MTADFKVLNPNFDEVTRRFLMDMPIAQNFGFQITLVEPGRFEITQPYRRELCFRDGVFQAGAVGALADFAGGCACMSLLPEGWVASTIDFTLKMLAPATGEKLVARGRVVQPGQTISVGAADVYSIRDGKETLCATALVTMRNFRLAASAGKLDGQGR